MDVDAIAISGDWIRHAPQHSALLGRANEPTDGRWQHGAVVRGLYLADEPATAIAEWYRRLAELGLPPAQATPHDHHIWQLDLDLADLSSPERLAAIGLQPPRPSRHTWPAYQTIGERLWHAGWAGLIAPSAARPTALIACVFYDASWPPPGCQPVSATQITDIPPPPTGMTT